MSKLEDKFEEMVRRVREDDHITLKPSNRQKLEIYALYKQATEGDAPADVPDDLEFVEKMKYKSWKQRADMSKTEAMEAYIAYFEADTTSDESRSADGEKQSTDDEKQSTDGEKQSTDGEKQSTDDEKQSTDDEKQNTE